MIINVITNILLRNKGNVMYYSKFIPKVNSWWDGSGDEQKGMFYLFLLSVVRQINSI